MNILDMASSKTFTCTHQTGDCVWSLSATGTRGCDLCCKEKEEFNAAIDAQIEKLQALDVPAQIAALQAQKRV